MNVPNKFIGNLEPYFTRFFSSQDWILYGLKRNNFVKLQALIFYGEMEKIGLVIIRIRTVNEGSIDHMQNDMKPMRDRRLDYISGLVSIPFFFNQL